MAKVKTQTQKISVDGAEMTYDMIVTLYHQYQYDRIVAIRKVSKIQRDLTKAEHEVHRLDRHLSRIEEFCKKNNISLEESA